MKIAILSNVTVEVLAGMLKDEHELWLAPGFGAWVETALAVPPAMKAFAPEAVFLLLDSSHASFDPAAVETAVASLEAALPHTTVLVPDLNDLFAAPPSTPNPPPSSLIFFDDRMWQVGAMPWSLKGLRAIRDEMDRLLRAMKGARRKVLALDFDNVLWDGVIGEDGIGGIRPRADFQRAVRDLRARGVLLVGLSKNNAADVEPVWGDPRMVLKREDFAELRIDWNDKPSNLEAVARTLNLGTDAFVFVDDSPAERAEMAARHPEVAVADWPVSVRHLTRLHFPRMRLTEEDRLKTERYRDEVKRRERAEGLSFDDWLRDLEIRTEIHPVREAEYARVAQLSQKANQFNVTTHRYTAEDVARFAADPAHLLVTARVADRFGDLGLVAFVHVARCGAAGEIVDWVMSCRAMNRRIEFTVERHVEDELRRRGVTILRATWRRTPKNAPVGDLFDRFGFTPLRMTETCREYGKVLCTT